MSVAFSWFIMDSLQVRVLPYDPSIARMTQMYIFNYPQLKISTVYLRQYFNSKSLMDEIMNRLTVEGKVVIKSEWAKLD